MLKGIPAILSPELLIIMMEMGHGDEIVIGDGNFPAVSCAKRCIRADGHSAPELLEAILKYLPLDTYATPVYLMEKAAGDPVETPIWEVYKDIVKRYDATAQTDFLERFAFYERAKNAYAVIATSEKAFKSQQ